MFGPPENHLATHDVEWSTRPYMLNAEPLIPASRRVMIGAQAAGTALALACRLNQAQRARVAKLESVGLPSASAVQLQNTLQLSLDLLERYRTTLLGLIDSIESSHIALGKSRELLARGPFDRVRPEHGRGHMTLHTDGAEPVTLVG